MSENVKVILFSSSRCVHCPVAEKALKDAGIEFEKVLVDSGQGFALAQEYGVLALPSVIVVGSNGVRKIVGLPADIVKKVIAYIDEVK